MLVLILGLLLLKQDLNHLIDQPLNEFRRSQAMTLSVYADYRQKNKSGDKLDFDVLVIGPAHTWNWDSTIFWYFLEEITQQKLVEIVPEDNNVLPLARDPDYLYLVCKDFNLHQENINEDCLKSFFLKNNQWGLDQKEAILSSEHPDVIIFRLKKIAIL